MCLRSPSNFKRVWCVTIFSTFFIVTVIFPYGVQSKDIESVKSDSSVKVLKKSMEKEEKIFGKVEKSRTMESSMMMPVMIGMLIKMAATIPLILTVAIFVGTISILGSKLSLIISSILAIKQLISMISATPTMTTPMISNDDFADLQQVMAKMPSIPMSNPKINLPIPKPIPIPIEMMKQEMMKTDNLMHSNPNNQQWNDWYLNYNNILKDNLYNPESYFAYTPTGAAYNTYESLKNNQAVLDETSQVAGAHIVQDLDRSNGQVFEPVDSSNLAQKRAQVMARAEMAQRANAVIQRQQLDNPNRRMGVKIIKTVTKHVT